MTDRYGKFISQKRTLVEYGTVEFMRKNVFYLKIKYLMT